MVDPGEMVSQTLQREFSEEALNSLTAPPQERKMIHERITKLFSSPGLQVRSDLFTKRVTEQIKSCTVLELGCFFLLGV